MLCAVSGGADSLALAHAVSRLPRPLRLIHVNHHLHPDCDQWAATVKDFAARHDLAVTTADVAVDARSNVEARARDARYRAIFDAAMPNEVVLTAHHQDDQAVTMLLQLLRGAGPAGLAAMPAVAQIGEHLLMRPLLGVAGQELRDYCHAEGLAPIQDPGNDDLRFDRNYLTHEVIPQLAVRWPAYARTLSRSAQHCAQADALLRELAVADTPMGAAFVDVSSARIASDARAGNALRTWLRERDIERPATVRLLEFVRQVRTSSNDAAPQLALGRVILRAYDGVVFASRALSPVAQWQAPLVSEQAVTLPDDIGQLIWHGDGPALQVRFRRGGERFGHKPARRLKTWLQAQRVLPWQRGRVPLVFAGNDLLAIGDWWQSKSLAGSVQWETAARYRLAAAAAPADLRVMPRIS